MFNDSVVRITTPTEWITHDDAASKLDRICQKGMKEHGEKNVKGRKYDSGSQMLGKYAYI